MIKFYLFITNFAVSNTFFNQFKKYAKAAHGQIVPDL